MSAMTNVGAAYVLVTRYLLALGRTFNMCLRCSHMKKSARVRSNNQGGHAMNPPNPIHCPAYDILPMEC
jgi:hypothetical protein